MKLYSYKKAVMDTWNQEERTEDFQPQDYIHLGDIDDRQFFSYNPETVKLAENDAEKYDVKEYDPKKKADREILESLKGSLTVVKEEVLTKKSELFANMDLFDMVCGIVNQDKYIIEKIKQTQLDIEDIYKKYGF